MTYLHAYILQGDINIIKQFIESVSNINELQDGVAIIHHAVYQKNLPAVQYMLDCGADVNVKSMHDSTPLHFSTIRAVGENYEMIRLLLERGANYNDGGSNGLTPFHLALANANLKSVQLFVEFGADITTVDDNGGTALHCAVRNPHLDVIQFVLDHGIDVEGLRVIDNDCRSALELAVYDYASADTCELLIQRGAIVNTSNPFDNHMPLSLAVMSDSKNARIVQVLLEHGANVLVTIKGDSIFKLATGEVHNETIVNLLIRELAKLEALHLDIYDEDRQLIESNDSRSQYYQMCVQELCQMKAAMFYSKVSVLRIFLANDAVLSGYARNEELVKALEENRYENKFPIYFSSLKKRFDAEVLKQRSRNRAAETLSNLFQFNDPFNLINQKILSYMRQEDFVFLSKH